MTNDRLQQLMLDLVNALLRQGTERDGNWGYPSTTEALQRIQGELAGDPVRQPQGSESPK